MRGESQPGDRCVEVLAVAFGDTIVDAALLDGRAPSYVIGEGHRVRLPVGGDGLPNPGRHELVRRERGQLWLAFGEGMQGVRIDDEGRRSLAGLAEDCPLAEDGARLLRLEPGQTVWLALPGVRVRVRLATGEREHLPRCGAVDRAHLASLLATGLLALIFSLLLRAQPPAPLLLDQDRVALLNRLVLHEPVKDEAPEELEPPAPTSTPVEPRAIDAREPDATEPRPRVRPPEPDELVTSRRMSREPFYAAASAAQAVGKLGRNHDPVEAARHAGMLGVLDGRRFAGERVFDPEIDDAALWASTAEMGSTAIDAVIGTGTRFPRGGRGGGEGLIGMGSYGSIHHSLANSNGRYDARTSLCPPDGCFGRRKMPVSNVRFGRVAVHGSMDPDLARRIVRAHINEVRSCFQSTIPEPEAKHGAEIELAVSNGQVSAVVVGPGLPSAFGECVERAMKRWKFPVGTGTDLLTFGLHLSRER